MITTARMKLVSLLCACLLGDSALTPKQQEKVCTQWARARARAFAQEPITTQAAIATATADEKVSFVLATLDKMERIGRRAAGRGSTSDTSRQEAGLAARARVLRAFRTVDGAARVCARWTYDASAAQTVELVAVKAARASLRGDEFNGMTGRDSGRAQGSLVTCAAAELAWAMLPALDAAEFSRPVGRGVRQALTLRRACRRLATARIASMAEAHARENHGRPPGVIASAWARTLSAYKLRVRRTARVLTLVALGDSLELACQRAGFAWSAAEGRSPSFARAYDETGLRAGLEQDRSTPWFHPDHRHAGK